jgi:hypothetical protein
MASLRTRKLAKELLVALLQRQGMGGETAEILGRNVGAAYNAIVDELGKCESDTEEEEDASDGSR